MVGGVASCAPSHPHASPVVVEKVDGVTRRQIAVSVAVGDPRTPTRAAIDELEPLLTRERCVNGISRWSRRYAFGLNERDILTTDRIDFALRSPAVARTRQVVSYGAFPELDDRQYERVDGYYQPSTGQIRTTYCGPNRR